TACCWIPGAMPADVIERSQNAVVATDDQQRLADQIKCKVIAGSGNLSRMSYGLPTSGEDALLLFFEYLFAVIPRRRPGRRARNIVIRAHFHIKLWRANERTF